jgi:hypothetical protein
MKKLVTLVAAASFLLTASIALANGKGAQTFTFHQKNVTETFADVVPCVDGETIPAVVTTTTKNRVIHITAEPGAEIEFDPVTGEPIVVSGEFHVTGTDVGTFEAVTAEGTIEGHFAIWFGFNQNGQNQAGTFTFNVEGRWTSGAMAGEPIGAHLVDHFNTSASTPPHVNAFFHLTCSHGAEEAP